MAKKILYYSTAIIVGAYFLFLGVAKAQEVLAPLVTAVTLALLVLPLANKLEAKMKRAYSALVNTILLFIVSILFAGVVAFQVQNFVDDWPEIKETMKPKIEQLKTFIANNTPVSEGDLNEISGDKMMSSDSESEEQAISVIGKVFGFMGIYLLTFVYIFFLLNYRKRFKDFLLHLFPDGQEQDVKKAIDESATVVQQYLVGKLILIGLLAILYMIGLGISGVDNFILISIIAAFITLIPYIGTIIGFFLAMSFGYLSSGELWVLIGIVLTFSIAQFVESYIFEPYIVGDRVDLHPFFVIVIIIIGNAVWGVIGMILAIPVFAIITIILLHVDALKPFGYLFSNKPSSR